MTTAAGLPPSATYLLGRLGLIERRVRRLVDQRRTDDPNPDDPFRGLYLSDEHIDRILDGPGPAPTGDWGDEADRARLDSEADAAGEPVRLRQLAERAGLDPLDVDLLLVAVAPDLDARFERIYGYLNDDVTRRRATIGLAIDIGGASAWSADARGRLEPGGRLVASGLVTIEDNDRPLLSRGLRVPDRVTAHLLGRDDPDATLAGLVADAPGAPGGDLAPSIGRVVARGTRLVYLREKVGASAAAVGAAACQAAGFVPLVFDLRQLRPDQDLVEVAGWIWREGLLRGGAVVVGPIDVLPERENPPYRALAEAGRRAGSWEGCRSGAAGPSRPDPVPMVLYGRRAWEPAWSRTVPLVAEVEPGNVAERARLWHDRLEGHGAADLAASEVIGQFLLSADQVSRAVDAARLQAVFDGRPIDVGHLRAGARGQNGAGLERLARRIHPRVGWTDLVLTTATENSLRSLATRARQRGRVLDEWGLRPGGGRGRGITALFAGDSGTGKTMSAEVVAGDLGLDLYTVNLATVVDKYVGETEKNLERIFTEADGVNAVLLFDEADAIFGKRSEVRDANDRYANIEVAYLLQRMETFDGIAVLSTNLRANVDEAFARRLDLIVDFPAPEPELRRALWEKCLPPAVPRSPDLDLDFCAGAFELSGGNIRSAAITAAYFAADGGRPVSMVDLVRAISAEYKKLGRLVVAREFGPYHDLAVTA